MPEGCQHFAGCIMLMFNGSLTPSSIMRAEKKTSQVSLTVGGICTNSKVNQLCGFLFKSWWFH